MRLFIKIVCIQSVDEQAEFTKQVLGEVGLLASQEVVASRLEEKDKECRQKIFKLAQLLQERAQLTQMAEKNKALQHEIDQIEAELMESRETVLQLESEAEEAMRDIREKRLEESRRSKVTWVRQEEREVQGRPSMTTQAGERPEETDDQRRVLQEDLNTPHFQPASVVVGKFVFKRK